MGDRQVRPTRRERDLRQYSRATQLRLIVGGIVILLVIGTGLIWWIYGSQAARLGALCLLAGLVPGLLIAGWLWLLDRLVRRSRNE
ncbi:MAG: hypothetical protein GTO14_25835 [Anaerolineales bacterium]|nr:hypothetical protein [Anaerolineales bacterium]